MQKVQHFCASVIFYTLIFFVLLNNFSGNDLSEAIKYFIE
jgi:hypothetical protein